jgi:hypothetical protein
MKALAIILVIIANQRAGAMAHNPYTGWMDGHNAMVNPYLSKFDDIGRLPIAVTLRGIEEALHVASMRYDQGCGAIEDVQRWLENCRSHCDDTPEGLNFAHLVAVILCMWHGEYELLDIGDETEPEEDERETEPEHCASKPEYSEDEGEGKSEDELEHGPSARGWLDQYNHTIAFRSALTHNAPEDIRRHMNGFKLMPLIDRANNQRRWRSADYTVSERDLSKVGNAGEAEDMWPYELALVAISAGSNRREIQNAAMGRLSGPGPKSRDSIIAANAIALTLSSMGEHAPANRSMALPAHMARIALGDRSEFRYSEVVPVEIYLGLRILLCQFADNRVELQNSCLYQTMTNTSGPHLARSAPEVYVGDLEIDTERFGMTRAGSSVIGALKLQPDMPGLLGGVRKTIELPVEPAIRIRRYPVVGRGKKDNRRVHVDPFIYITNGEEWCDKAGRAPYTEYELLAAMLHKADGDEFALIVPRYTYVDREANRRTKVWALLTADGSREYPVGDDVHRLTDGDGTGGYNAVLALYRSYTCAVETVTGDDES